MRQKAASSLTLQQCPDNEVGMVIDNGRLIVEPHRRPQYSLAELLAQCDPNAEISAEEREWLDAPAAGQEEI
ncbi:antitoxin (plasmid) [Klebsiella pneumoniae]|uniref:AbrB/MazE/SpoVT family DNA-binding domain-containing protein n=1 Tax=Klebsiella pneumoniae TaxID=573 RepID=UPI002014D4DD|nr:antitoxin [Klebsiella pneumoniae]MCL3040111.1 antitoxin [Klebsiella pneumoniae]MCL3045542.1 antitoxin [Klebsiella pneumoniae]MCL3072713.1 antitoxin [Klebsiella pneumoniae]MCL3078140.1 antitoxin [Klebsiella pneumoniae]MCL3083579.1 antitoxin [Klebsiella pneumoniae]